MSIVLDHMTVPVVDHEMSVGFYTGVFGARRGSTRGRIVGVWLSDVLELQFRLAQSVEGQHYAFRLDDHEFAATVARLAELGIAYGPSRDQLNGEVLVGQRGEKTVFFSDPSGHSLEVIAVPG